MKVVVLLMLTLSSYLYSDCHTEDYSVQFNVKNKTFDRSYNLEKGVRFKKKDNITIINKESGETYTLSRGRLVNDGAGNFYIDARSKDASVHIAHDHEIWDDGVPVDFQIDGHEPIELSLQDCSWDDLFIFVD